MHSLGHLVAAVDSCLTNTLDVSSIHLAICSSFLQKGSKLSSNHPVISSFKGKLLLHHSDVFFVVDFFHFRRVISVLIDCACCQWKRNTFVHLMPSLSYETIWIKKKKQNIRHTVVLYESDTNVNEFWRELQWH